MRLNQYPGINVRLFLASIVALFLFVSCVPATKPGGAANAGGETDSLGSGSGGGAGGGGAGVGTITKLVVSGSSSILLNACTVYTVTPKDASNVSGALASLTRVNLSGGGAGVFYANSTDCGSSSNAITFFNMAAGATSGSFYYKNGTAQTNLLTVTDNAALLSGSTLSVTTATGPPASISVSANNNQTGVISTALASAFIAVVKDANNNVISGRTVNWAVVLGGGSLSSSSNSTDGSGLSSSTLTLGGSVGTNTATATVNGTALSVTFTATAVASNDATKLVILSYTAIAGGRCRPYTVVSQNASSVLTAVTSNITVNLSKSKNGAFYSSSGDCGTSSNAITTTSISSGQSSSATFYFKDNTVESANILTAADNGASLTSGTLSVDVGGPASLAITGTSAFGDVYINTKVGAEAFSTLTVTNSGAGSAINMAEGTAMSAPYAFYGGTYPGHRGTCGTTLGAGATCTVTISFNPTTNVTSNDTLSLDYEDDGYETYTATKAISGTGVRILQSVGSSYAHHVLLSNGKIRSWGFTSYGEFGNGDVAYNDWSIPNKEVTGISTAIQIAASSYHVCALLANGTIQCWGYNGNGQLGDGTIVDSYTPITVSGITTATQVAVGTYNTCALLLDGTVSCWGDGGVGMLGNSTNDPSSVPVSTDALGQDATAISVGGNTACALLADESVKCWGANTGDGSGTSSNTPVLVVDVGSVAITDVNSLSASSITLYALKNDGTVWAWGDGVNGQIGDGGGAYRAYAAAVTGISTASHIASNYYGACATLADQTVECWGYNATGQLGDGTMTERWSPVAVSGLSGAIATDMTWASSCALLSDYTVKCWGENRGIQGFGFIPSIIDGTTHILAPTYKTLLFPHKVLQTATGLYHSCALLNTGIVRCWGLNTSGQLGDASVIEKHTPVTVSGISTATSIAAGNNHTCATLTDSTVKCWGENEWYQLGNGNQTDQTSPVTVTGLSNAVELAAGASHTCARLSDGTIKCWGLGTSGQLGNSVSNTSSTIVSVTGISTASQVSSGDNHSCAVLANGTVKCWGDNLYGQLGDGTKPTDQNAPVTASGISTALQMMSGFNHSCTRLSDLTIMCWGLNANGQLDTGDYVDQSVPILGTSTGTAVTGIYGGGNITSIIDPNLYSVGSNITGELGAGFGVGLNYTAAQVTYIDPELRFTPAGSSTGAGHTCAYSSEGVVSCWGNNSNGQLGDGTVVDSSQGFFYTIAGPVD